MLPQDFERKDVLVLVAGMGIAVTRINALIILEYLK